MTDEEDKALFRQMMHGVKPLKQKALHVHHAPKPSPQKKTEQQPSTLTTRIVEPFIYRDHIEDFDIYAETVLSHNPYHLPKQQFLKLKKGLIPLEAKLDLHGASRNQASHVIHDFLQKAQAQQKRCVLIIHGKGGQIDTRAILKTYVYQWLSNASDVLAFHSAMPKDGGNGAVYVLLKNKLNLQI